MGNRPARRPADKAKALLPVQPVYLVDHPVDIIFQPRSLCLYGSVVSENVLNRLDTDHAGICDKPPIGKSPDRFKLGFGKSITCRRPGIGEEAQRPGFGDLDIKLAQAPRRSVAWICEYLAPGLGFPCIEIGKGGFGHIDLAAHLDPLRPSLAFEFDRDVAEGAGVGRYVFAGLPVAAGCRAHQLAMLVGQAQRQTVNLRLGCECQGLISGKPQKAPDANGKVRHIFIRERIVERQHRRAVARLGKAIPGFCADPVAGRILTLQRREPRLDRQVSLAQGVVFGIGQLGRVVLVIGRICICNGPGQPLQLRRRFTFAQRLDRLVPAHASSINLPAAARASSVTSAPDNMRAISSRRPLASSKVSCVPPASGGFSISQ